MAFCFTHVYVVAIQTMNTSNLTHIFIVVGFNLNCYKHTVKMLTLVFLETLNQLVYGRTSSTNFTLCLLKFLKTLESAPHLNKSLLRMEDAFTAGEVLIVLLTFNILLVDG